MASSKQPTKVGRSTSSKAALASFSFSARFTADDRTTVSAASPKVASSPRGPSPRWSSTVLLFRHSGPDPPRPRPRHYACRTKLGTSASVRTMRSARSLSSWVPGSRLLRRPRRRRRGPAPGQRHRRHVPRPNAVPTVMPLIRSSSPDTYGPRVRLRRRRARSPARTGCGGARRSGRRRPAARSWVPRSTIRPSSTTRMRSASRMVERRWAMTRAVRPARASASASCTAASDSESRWAVASSRITTRGWASRRRAMVRRWRSPPEKR